MPNELHRAGVLAKCFMVNLRGWGRAGGRFLMNRVEGKGVIRASTSLLVEWVDWELAKELSWGRRLVRLSGCACWVETMPATN